MNLISKVVFEYNIIAGRVKETSSFQEFEELKQIIKNATYQKPFNLHVSRNIQIIDNDLKPIEERVFWFVNPEFTDRSIRAEIKGEHLNFIVMDKLLFPNELRKNLAEKYKDIENLNWPTRFEYEPVKNFKITEKLRDEKIVRLLYFSRLTSGDIVVDKNLNQIWPEKTGKAPSALAQLLSKTQEVIR